MATDMVLADAFTVDLRDLAQGDSDPNESFLDRMRRERQEAWADSNWPLKAAGHALFWYLVPTLISPERPDSNFWPGLLGVGAASALVRATPGDVGTALGLGTVVALWLTRGDARLWSGR